jgi:hypothetical protein
MQVHSAPLNTNTRTNFDQALEIGKAMKIEAAYLHGLKIAKDRPPINSSSDTLEESSLPMFIWMISAAVDPDQARRDAGQLLEETTSMLHIGEADVAAIFGGRYYYIGLPSRLVGASRSFQFHAIALRFAQSIASAADVMINMSIYAQRPAPTRGSDSLVGARLLTANDLFIATHAEIRKNKGQHCPAIWAPTCSRSERAESQWRSAQATVLASN